MTTTRRADAMPDPGQWANPVVVIAGNRWDGLGSSDRQLALSLAAHTPVLYIDPPATGWPQHRRRVDVPHPGVLRVTPTVPRGMYRPGAHHLLPHLVARCLASALLRLRTEASAVIVACPSPILSLINARCRVLYATDDWVAGATLMRLPTRRIRRLQSSQAAHSDIVIAISETLAEQYRTLGHRQVVVVPNGCDIDTLANVDDVPAARDVDLPHPIAGILGHLTDRISLEHLEAVAATPLSLLIVGPRHDGFGGTRFDDLVRRPNVCWVGERPYRQIPSYLRLIDVGLTPYTLSAFNRASSPLKTIEYLAAGRGSVATDLPGVRAFHTDQVTIATSPAEFADAVHQVSRIDRTANVVAARHAAVRDHAWALRALDVTRALSSCRPEAAPVPHRLP